jgi:phosphohistidine phosphatase
VGNKKWEIIICKLRTMNYELLITTCELLVVNWRLRSGSGEFSWLLKLSIESLMRKPAYYYNQSAVIPFVVENGRLKILLISNRSRRKWIVPKGIVEENLTSAESAAKEAFEEAGLQGTVLAGNIGTYRYSKWEGVCTVQVFAMKIEQVLKNWPERAFRYRIWAGLNEAATLIKDRELRKMIWNLSGFLK